MGPPNDIVFRPSVGLEQERLKEIKGDAEGTVARLEGIIEDLEKPQGHPFGRWVRMFVAKRGHRIVDRMVDYISAEIASNEP